MRKTNFGTALIALSILAGCAHYEPVEPQRDYGSVLQTFDQIVGQALFDPRVVNSEEWQEFRGNFGRAGALALNDEEFRAAFVTARDGSTLFSHFDLWVKNPSKAAEAVDVPLSFEIIADDIGVLQISSFDQPGLYPNLDAKFDEIIESDVATLIIDLRGNPGGTFAAWPVLDRIAKDDFRIGQLVANRWYSQNSDAPTVAQIAAATPLTAPDPKALAQDLMDDGLLALGVTPRGMRFAGTTYVLIDQQTASTSEIVAGTLQFNNLATVVGAQSAGEVLNAERMPLAEGLTLLLPIADFMLPNGSRLEGSGVTPDFQAGPADALQCAVQLSQGKDGC